MAFVGLDAEVYDRQYKDRFLMKRIIEYFSPHRREMVIVIIFLILGAIGNALVPILITLAINDLETNPNLTYILFLLIIIFLINALSFVFTYFRMIYSSRAIGNVVLDLRRDANAAVLKHDLSFFDNNPTGKIVSRINTDSQDFGRTVELTIHVISSIVIVIFLLIMMAFISLRLMLIFVISIPLFFIVAFTFRKLARRNTLLGQRALASVNAFVKETLSGIQIAKTFRQEEKLYEEFKKVNKQSYSVNLKRAFVFNIFFPLLGIIQGVVLMLIIFYGGSDVISGQISVGELNLFLQSLWLLMFPLFMISAFWPQFQAGLAASERIFALIDATPAVIQDDDVKPSKFKGDIEIKNLTFHYVEGTDIFQNFSLTIQPGETIALVGHTGAGKSSLASLLARFYEFQEGDILIDSISIRNYNLTEFRKQIGIIPQVPFLWSDTIENNIKYCCPTAEKKEVLIALDKTGGSDWIDDLSKGLRTNVGERGSLISMGQRQLVVFARVLLEDPSILILDEATASVDPFTEIRIQEALEKTTKGRTSIIIAHRLWTVRHVDRIIVLDHGKIVEEGNHDELMIKGGKYAELYNTYFRHQSLEYIEKMKVE